MLSTLISPDGGNVKIDGLDIIQDEKKIKRKINMIAGGERMIYWRLTAVENLQYFGRLYGIVDSVLSPRINKLLKSVGLYERRNESLEGFSKGMKQPLQIARGQINDPDYLFLDEPTLGLDVPVAKILRDHTKMLAKKENKGILLTSHYMTEFEELCDYVYIIDKGKNLMEGTPSSISKLINKCSKRYQISLTNVKDSFESFIECYSKQLPFEYKLIKINKDIDLRISSEKDIQRDIFYGLIKHADISQFDTLNPGLEEALLKISGENVSV